MKKRRQRFLLLYLMENKFLPIAITTQTVSTNLHISTAEWTVFLKYLVAKSRSLLNVDGRELNLVPSVTRELALFKGWYYKGVSSANYLIILLWARTEDVLCHVRTTSTFAILDCLIYNIDDLHLQHNCIIHRDTTKLFIMLHHDWLHSTVRLLVRTCTSIQALRVR